MGKPEAGFELHHLVKVKEPKLVVTALPAATENQQTRLFRQMESYVEGVIEQEDISIPADIDDSKILKPLLEMVAPALNYNPRRYTQFINNFRLNARIMYRLGKLYDREEKPRMPYLSSEKWTYEQLAKIEAIALRWPLIIQEAQDSQNKDSAYDLFANLIDVSPKEITRWHAIRELRELLRFSFPNRSENCDMRWINHGIRFDIVGPFQEAPYETPADIQD